MKKLFTIDNIMVSCIAALGYGYGEIIGKYFGLPPLLIMAACMTLGIAAEMIISKIIFSEAIQRKPMRRVMVYLGCFLIFMTAHWYSMNWLGVSMLDYMMEEIAFTIGFPILGFVVNMLIRAWRTYKVRQRYGDGSSGYVFDVDSEDIEEVNRQNHPITGDYDAELAVKTRTGVFVGERVKKTICFCGIPYAKPPVGERRWKAPEPLPDSDAVYEAVNFGASAIQVEHKGSILKHHRQSEDCLTLNICVGSRKSEEKKPVLVLFHLGDFSYGGTVDPLLAGGNLVTQHPDTVFVSFNHRLGILGFIDFSEVPGGEACPDAPNLGLMDQLAALKWIRENISAFGGDPERITVMGFEAGATSILLLAASGRARGLFQRAVVFNGNLETVYNTPDASRDLARRLLRETRTSTMRELMQLSPEALKAAAQKLWPRLCAPTCDGTWLPADIDRALKEGARDIAYIVGIPSNERMVIRSFVGDAHYEELLSMAVDDMKKTLGSPAAEAVQAYIDDQAARSSQSGAKSRFMEQYIALGAYHSAVLLAEGGKSVHMLYWDEKLLIEKLGSGTVDAAAVLLGNSEAALMYGSVMNNDLSETLQFLLHKFIAGRDLELYPNEIKGVDALDWKPFPKALVVSNDELLCEKIEHRLTEIGGLMEHFRR